MPPGRKRSLTLLALGALLLTIGVGVAVASLGGLLLGTGVAVAVFGIQLVAGGLFLPLGPEVDPASLLPPEYQRPIHGVIP